jgi:heme/copper-type cytochrome/quinol oxidase subunit 3
MTDVSPTAGETAEMVARDQSTGARLFVAADAFLFLGFLFAYLYLRTLNNNGMWNPRGENPSGVMGVAVLVAVVVTAALLTIAGRRLASAGPAAYRAPAVAAVVTGLVATVLAASQVFRPGFSPIHAGSFGSVFIGFMAFYFLHLLGGVYWVEIQVAQPPAEGLRGDAPPALLYWWFLGVVLLIFTVLFYVA